MNNGVTSLFFCADGSLYAGGGFTNAGGVTANCFAKWDGTSWTNLGSGMNYGVSELACDTNGQLYAGGYFTNAGGVPANNIAKWDGTSWTNLGSGMNSGVDALACDTNGQLYAGGNFTNAGGVPANRIAKWDGTSWTNLGSGMNSTVRALACDANGQLYAGGLFTNAGGVPANYVAKWDGTSWTNLGSGMNLIVSALACDANGRLYAGGGFTNAGGVPAKYIAKWMPGGAIGISPSSLSYTATHGGANPAPQVFVVSNTGSSGFTFTNTVSYSAGASGWFNPSVLTGAVSGHGSLTVTASVNIAGLSAGTYMATNTISSPTAANSPQTLVATLTVNLTTPTGVSASDGTYTDKVRVLWTAVSGATAYEVWRNTSDTVGSATNLGDTANTSYDNTGVSGDVTYYYWVKAKTLWLTSAFSASDSGWSAVSISLPTPTGVSASDGEFADKVQLTWLQLPAVTHYQVWRNTANNVSGSEQLTEIAGSDTVSYEDISASIDVMYYYWIRAKTVTAHGQEFLSRFSNSEMGYRAPSTSMLDPPSGFAASDGTYTDKVRVTWNRVTGAGMYEVWRNTINFIGYATTLGTTTNLTYDDTNVTANITYYYWVRARNPIAVSTFSMPDVGFAAPGTGTGNADLTALNLVFLPGVLGVGDHPGAVSMMLINYGPDSVIAPNARVGIDFHLSGNTSYGDSDDVWFGNYSGDVTLGVSSYLTLPLSTVARQGLTIPTVTAGVYNVFAKVRHESPSMLTDPDLSNNSVMRVGTIAVTSSGPGPGYHLINDYDGDGKSDVALYKEVTGEWQIMLSGDSYASVQFILGGNNYRPVIADYDGDGKADPAVCNQNTGEWKALFFDSVYSTITFDFGGQTDMPVPIDYDRDGKADPAIYQQSGNWVMLLSGLEYAEQTMTLGDNNYVPVPADYDGDGFSDLAVYRSSTGDWMLKLSTLDYWTMEFRFGGSGAIPVPADYDGDGKADMAVYKESSGSWSVMMSRFDYLTAVAKFGGQGWVPVAADYDGDGKEDIAIYNDDQHLLKVLMSGSYYGLITLDVGGPGYEPVGWPR
ncbi:MAG: FG-GAP-like repeat-containing protein [Kiritimatiellae bacterium]|nr:FG-GAP-like repeat-containing protein [Kiritimatiellia bacterium]